MKRCMLLVVVFCLLLSMTACTAVSGEGKKPEAAAPGATEPDKTEPDATQPDTTEPDVTEPTAPDATEPQGIPDLVYDLSNDQGLSDIFKEKTVEEWNAMGRYTLHLGGLHTPVVMDMDGTSVLSISAFDQTVDLGTDGMANDYHDGYSPVYYIRSTEDTVVINVSFGESGAGSIVITNVDCFVYPQTYWGGLLLLSVQKDGTLGYVSESHVEAAFSQAWIVGLQAATDRNEVIFEKGSAAIINRKLVLTAKETVVLSDRYDLDAMFAEVKSDRWFAEYETVDDLLAANKADRAPVELVFDVNGSVFLEKPVEEWSNMGRYTIRLEGLHTPVVVNMDATSVLSVTAYDQTVHLGAAGMANDYFDGYSPVDYIRSTEDAVVIGINGGESPDDFILITKDKVFQYPNKRDGHVDFWVEDDGTLAYRQTYFDMSLFVQTLYEPLKYLTGRDHVLYDEGRAQIVNSEAVFTPERMVVVSDLFDLDAMFAEAKADGMFTEYETVDELFEANKENV